MNDSIYFACHHTGVQGTMWISSDISKTSVTSKVKVEDWTNGFVTAYLHGAIIRGSSSPATNIKIVKGTTQIIGTAEGYSNFEPLLDIPDKMNRIGNLNPNTGTIKSSVESIRIKISWIATRKKSELYYTINKDGNREYSIPIQAFRCYGNLVPAVGNQGCFSSSSTLNIEVKVLTLSGIARDVNGTKLGSDPKPHEGLAPGKKGTITRNAIKGYKFLGWSWATSGAPTSSCGDSCPSFSVSNMREDATVYAVYEKEDDSVCPVADKPASYINSSISNGVTSTVSRVKNETLGQNWSTQTFAKPSDMVSWGHCYFPGVQYVANATIKEGGRTVTIQEKLRPWENKYTVSRGSSVVRDWSADAGVTRLESFLDNNYPIDVKLVGTSLKEEIVTGKPVSAKVSGNSYSPLSADGPTSSSADVVIPFNFTNSIKLMDVDDKVYFYAGESSVIESTIQVGERENRLTSGTYATRVDGAKTKLRVCYNDNTVCADTETKDLGTLNQDGNSKGDSRNEKFGFDVPDLPAGSRVCVRSAVYPKDSYLDDNINASVYAVDNDDSWTWSDEFCFNVAKRPSIQAWGGNVYSSGAIKTSRSVKQDLYGSNNSKKPYVFGSWGELGVISAGNVSGFASGASLGYKNNGGRAWPEYAGNTDGYALGSDYPGGGFSSSDFCKYSVLTFPNSDCASGSVGGAGNSNSTKSINDNKDVLKSLIDVNMENKNREAYDVEYIDGFNDDGNTWIIKTNGELNISGGMLAKDTFKLFSANDNIVVNGDIKIGDDVILENFDQAPKVVLYSKKDIKIGCDVARLDAILVAEGSVITCASDEDIDSEVYSKQLIVNGAIITSKLKANRTYGAGRGINSIVPAEIVDFDPTLYLWGGAAGHSGKSGLNNLFDGNLVTTYVHELAPRY